MKNAKTKSDILSSIVEKVKETADEYFGYGENQEETMRKLFLEKTRGCLPDDFIDIDLNQSIYKKFYTVAHAIRCELAGQKQIDELCLRLVIEPSYEDVTYVDFVYEPRNFNSIRGFVIYSSGMKAWTYYFETLDEFKEYLWQEYTQVEHGYEAAIGLLENLAS